jgi:hypothetical protein
MRTHTKVFIGGSRRLSRLNKDVKSRLDNIIQKGFTVVLGDANGADKAVQHYLASRGYQQVIVFCVGRGCRNNIGHWPTREIDAAPGARGFAYFSTKDRVMGEEADYGLMLWDGRSRGTLTNILHLVRQGKPVVVYIAPQKSFYTLRQFDHLTEMVRRFDPTALYRIDRDLQGLGMGSVGGRTADAAPLF